MAQLPNKSLRFTVRRRTPELVAPAKPTPRELKLLSDIDDQDDLRFHIPVIHFYRNSHDPRMGGRDPVKVIREALAKALVFYYPLAGRLKEGAARKLMIDCTGEGVAFVEADAGVTLEQFGDALHPPFPCVEELLYDVPGSAGFLNSPLLLIQVTRLLCGSFIFGLHINHTTSDAQGVVQFMTAIAELAQGAPAPSILPVWQRELLLARETLRVTCTHHEYDQVPNTEGTITLLKDMAQHSFFFGPTEMSALRRFISPNPRKKYSTFEVLSACLWRCRTIALQLEPDEEVRMVCIVNSRGKFDPPFLPVGYYGNAFAYRGAISTTRKLCQKPFAYALELVRKAKCNVTKEYMRSLVDFLVIKGRPQVTMVRAYIVSDLTRAGFSEVDFGWGKAAYGGPIEGGPFSGYYIPFTNSKGCRGIVVPICLPAPAMERFVMELDSMLKQDISDLELQACKSSFASIKSAL